MSAWAEEWVFDGRRWLRTKPTDDEPYGVALAAFDYDANSIEAAGKLAAAAPAMARLLRALYAEHGNKACFDWAYWHGEIAEELERAGVPLPADDDFVSAFGVRDCEAPGCTRENGHDGDCTAEKRSADQPK